MEDPMPSSSFRRLRPRWRPHRASLGVFVGIIAACAPGCVGGDAALTQLMEARRLASELHVDFNKAAEASNRAVMSDADDTAQAAADEARTARGTIDRNLDALRQLLQSLGYRDDLDDLDAFALCYQDYRRADEEILPLAVENTNVKAQRLSFGPASDAADAFGSALDRAVQMAESRQRWPSEALAAQAMRELRHIQVLHAPHIAEADLAAMDRLEQQMASAEKAARQAVAQLQTTLPAAAAPSLADARRALDRFNTIHQQLIGLSRRNSDVHSLALSLGRKRDTAARCEAALQALEAALAKHGFTATR
jgi:hypothetical protein